MPSRYKNSTLLLMLGASEFPLASNLTPAAAFKNSHDAIKDYFVNSFGLASQDNLLDLFDSEENALVLYKKISKWLEQRLANIESAPNKITDLIIYYVGHGGFGESNEAYYLAIRSSEGSDLYTYSIQLSAVANILRNFAGMLRRFLIIDACFAGAAVGTFQGGKDALEDTLKKKLEASRWSDGSARLEQMPIAARGTSFLCASSRTNPAIFGPESTRFSEALITIFAKGVDIGKSDLTLREIQQLSWQYMQGRYGEKAVHPEVHSPDAGAGDIADAEIFPNAGYKPKEVTSAQYIIKGQLLGHTNHVDCARWSPDGRFIASGSYDNTIRIWDAQNHRCVQILQGHSKGISDVAWNPTGLMLASGSYDQTVRLWNPATGECVHCFSEHTDGVRCIDWAPNGRLIVSGDADSKVILWDSFNRSQFKSFAGKNLWINDVAFQPSSALIAVGLGGGDIAIYSPTVRDVKKIHAHQNYVNAVAWMPGTGQLCSGSGSGSIRVWDITKPTPVKELKEHRDKILRLSFSSDGRFLASLGQDRQVIWNCQTWKPVHTVEGPFPTNTYLPLAFAASGTMLVTADVSNPTAMQVVQLDG